MAIRQDITAAKMTETRSNIWLNRLRITRKDASTTEQLAPLGVEPTPF